MKSLPADNIHQRLCDLRNGTGKSQKEVADDLQIPASVLSRIERGETKAVSHDLVIKFAEYYNVSTDYLLCISNIRIRKNVELEEEVKPKTDSKPKEQQPDKFEIINRIEKEKKAMKKKHTESRGDQRPAKHTARPKRSGNIDGTREYENDSYDEDKKLKGDFPCMIIWDRIR